MVLTNRVKLTKWSLFSDSNWDSSKKVNWKISGISKTVNFSVSCLLFLHMIKERNIPYHQSF